MCGDLSLGCTAAKLDVAKPKSPTVESGLREHYRLWGESYPLLQSPFASAEPVSDSKMARELLRHTDEDICQFYISMELEGNWLSRIIREQK
jgi:hypothetical protein